MNKKQKDKQKKKRRVKQVLPILPLDQAIKRLGNDDAWNKASKGVPFDKKD